MPKPKKQEIYRRYDKMEELSKYEPYKQETQRIEQERVELEKLNNYWKCDL